MRESRTYGSGRGACHETHVPTATRREFIAGLAGALALPICRAAGQGKLARIGALALTHADAEGLTKALRNGLREQGYIEGQNFSLKISSADGITDRLPELAAELVLLPVDVIVAAFKPCVLAAKHATTTIPIVMAAVADPIGAGLVQKSGASRRHGDALRRRARQAVARHATGGEEAEIVRGVEGEAGEGAAVTCGEQRTSSRPLNFSPADRAERIQFRHPGRTTGDGDARIGCSVGGIVLLCRHGSAGTGHAPVAHDPDHRE